MTFKQFMEMYDNWNGNTKVKDDRFKKIVGGEKIDIMECIEPIHELSIVKNYGTLFAMEVVSFGFYDDELCVRVKQY